MLTTLNYTKRRPFYQYIILYGLALLILQLFQYRKIPVVVLKMSGFIAPALMFFCFFKTIWLNHYERGSIPYLIKCVLICAFFSYFMALVFWGQGILDSYRSSIWCLNLMFFFVLYKYKFTHKELLCFVTIFSIINIILWAYSITKAPEVTFGMIGEDDYSAHYNDNRGGFRIDIMGRDVVILLFFYYIVRMFKEKKTWLFALCFLIFAFICSDLTRSRIGSVIITVMLYVVFMSKNRMKMICMLALVAICSMLLINYFWGDLIDQLFSLTEDQFSGKMSNNDDGMWRIWEYKFFLFDFNDNIITTIFGNGFANSSPLNDYLNRLKETRSFYADDVSYMELFIPMGLLGLFIWLRMIFKSIKSSASDEVIYLKLYLWYALISNFTVGTLLMAIPLCISMYLIYMNSKKEKI